MTPLERHVSDERTSRKRQEVARLTEQHTAARQEVEHLMGVVEALDKLIRESAPDLRTPLALERVRVREDVQRAVSKAEKLLRERDDAQERLALWAQIRRLL